MWCKYSGGFMEDCGVGLARGVGVVWDCAGGGTFHRCPQEF